MSNEDKGLEARVRNLENKLYVATAVAAIFGISGAFGFSMLRTAQHQLAQLQQGVADVQDARDRAIKDINTDQQAQLSDLKSQLQPYVKQAVTAEMGTQIGQVKHWTAFIYAKANETGLPNGQGANGWWQKGLIDQNALVQSELK